MKKGNSYEFNQWNSEALEAMVQSYLVDLASYEVEQKTLSERSTMLRSLIANLKAEQGRRIKNEEN